VLAPLVDIRNGSGESLLKTIGLSVSAWPEARAAFEQEKAAAHAQLGEAAFAAAWAAGRAMTLDQAISYAVAKESES
jgi:hypothetical protein